MTGNDALHLDFLERAAIAEEVASVIRHDIRGRLSVLMTGILYVRRVVKSESPDPQLGRFLTAMDDAVDGAEKLLADRAAFGQYFGKDVGVAPLAGSIELGRTRFQARFPAPPPIEAESDGRPVRHSRLEIALALDCLLRNAAEAAPGRPIRIVQRTHGEETSIVVTDEGAGIAEAELERALTPLVSTKEGHLGLGLNIARRIALRHGGGLRFEKVDGKFRARIVLA